VGFLDYMLDISWNVFRIPSRIRLPLGQYSLGGKGRGTAIVAALDKATGLAGE